MCEWYEETKERRRSDENSEKKCVVIFLRVCQKWNAATMFFVILDRTGRSFVKWLLWQCFLDSFVFFVVKKWDIMHLFHWYARCYVHLIGKFESEVTKGWMIYASKGERWMKEPWHVMFIATDEHENSRHLRAAPCCSDAITNDDFNETAEYCASPVYEQWRSEGRKITLRDVAHPLTLRAMEERSLIRWHSKTLCTSKRFRAKTGRSPKRNIAHGNTMGKR